LVKQHDETMTFGKENGFLKWLGSAFGFIKRAVMFFKTGGTSES
jgi:hypothetical protein